MVARAHWQPEAIAGTPRDDRPSRPGPGAIPATPRWWPGLRPGAVAAGPRRHTVADGETFASIAQLYYGSAHYDEALRRFNRGRIAGPGWLTPGDLLVIPDVAQLDVLPTRPGRPESAPAPARAPEPPARGLVPDPPRRAEVRAGWMDRASRRDGGDPGAIATGSAGPAADPARRGEPRVHYVRRYETLRSIARDRLGDARRAVEIIELNPDRLRDSSHLAPGLRLLLPPDATPAPPAR
jgi:nucleoid-associated protein YgaU